MTIISIFWIFKISDIDQGIHKHAKEKEYTFSALLKKILSGKKKRQSYRTQDYVLQTKT